ncbi:MULTISPECIES: LytR/AlgR family response regulator transcription factor [unclassified Pedobacter]|jgi:DNA-binding LytR/AlgR family response regulator|uniref:LytR/AlgR family response regulator transcription factor n=1 Tax=Pedobacter TaxID=84567 RepID=UPI0022465B49|nr:MULTISPECIES: LytTR family DNA-binding domain-containing protein [unclassified Pedobacter]MCX2431241.1 LytTR family DNA-binding domain-containing protein [Pedobacter sp. GR22-10]MCX2584671.1 LytTR family DNA-binding domain-containing protein [Pedobacter sp. MR22-3]
MIRCLAVDDEAYASDIIAAFINKTPFLELVGTTTNPFEALNQVQAGMVDLVFLDIQMPELTGIQFLKILGGKCKVILTTAYPEYALEGFDLDVVDYLLKPIPYERFYQAAVKAQQMIHPAQQEIVMPLSTAIPDFIFIKGDTKNKFIKVNYTDILYIEGLKNYVSVYTSAQRIVTYQALRELENDLPKPPFYRIHKSYIISLDKIKMVDGNTVYINDQLLPVGDTYKEDFFRIIRERH